MELTNAISCVETTLIRLLGAVANSSGPEDVVGLGVVGDDTH